MAEQRNIEINVKVNGEDRLKNLGEKVIKIGDDVSKVGAGIAGAFSIASGTVGAFGDALGYSDEEIKKAQASATSYLAILSGIKPVFEGIVSGVRLAGQAFTVLSGIIAANPIGAIITGIGLAIAAVVYWFDEIKAAGVAAAEFIVDNWEVVATVLFPIPGLVASITSYFYEASDASVELGVAARAAAEEIENVQKESAKAAGAMVADFNEIYDARKKALDKEREALDKKYLYEKSLAIANGEDYKKLDKEYLENKLKTVQAELDLQLMRFKQVQKLRIEEEGFFDVEAMINKERKENAEKRLKELQDEFLQVKGALNDIADAEKEAAQKSADDYKAAWEKRNEETRRQLDLKQSMIEADAEFDREFNEKYLKQVEETKEIEVEINLEALEESTRAYEEASLAEYKNAYELFLAKKGLSEKEFKYQQQQEELRIGLVQGGFDVISSITELFGKKSEAAAKKAFAVNKAVGIAQAAIQTYQSAQGAYLSQLTVPSPDAPIRAAIAAGIATAAGLANIAKIASQKFEGGSPVSSTSPSTNGLSGGSASQTTPNLQLFGTAGAFNQGGSQGQSNGQPMMVQAVVSESDITQTVSRVANYRLSAEL